MPSPESPSPSDRTPAGGSGKPGKPGSKDRVLKALHAMAKPQPKALVEPLPPPTEQGGSTSGFVGMLAKGQFTGSGILSSERPPSTDDKPRHKYPLEMAREINAQSDPSATTADALRVPRPRVVRRHGGTVPVMLALAGLLLLIGAWAAGALIYMGNVEPAAPDEVHYPLIRWSYDTQDSPELVGGYTSGSRVMAWSMLTCLPLSAGLIVLALVLRGKRARAVN